MSIGSAFSRAGIVIWGVSGISVCVIPDSAPAWLRIGLAVGACAPIVALLLLWPVLLVRNLGEVPASDPAASEGQETRIRVLDGGDQR